MEEHFGEENNFLIQRVLCSVLLFIAGFYYAPLFIVAYLVSGFDVIICALNNLVTKDVFDEKFLMSIATLGALCIKEYPEAVMVMLLYQIGEFLQAKAVNKSKRSIEALINIRPDYANLNGRKVNPENVETGEIITVIPGEKIPLDGVVVEGAALVDNSALTGESVPVYIKEGDEVLSGGINNNGLLKIKVTHKYNESAVYKILELIEKSAEKKAKTENIITKFAKVYTPIVVILAVIIAAGLPLFADIGYKDSLHRALTFLVISCPCAFVISVPLSFFAGIGGASMAGILVKGGNYLEQLSKVGTVVFDKTGTLTTGIFGIREINSKNPEILKYAAIAESASTHPIAKAVINAYKGVIPEAEQITEDAGGGVTAVFEGKKIKAGTAKFIGVDPINTIGTVIYVSVDGDYLGNIVLADMIKPDSADTIMSLHNMNIKTAMFTGDTNERAETLKNIIEIQEVYSELLPADKVTMLEKLIQNNKKHKKTIIFIGDGINDAPVLKLADVGIAMGGLGSDAAIEAADVVIMDDKPSKIVKAIRISRKTISIVKQNILFAISIKVLFLILGGFGLMTMWGAVFADVGVSVLAILNALRARKTKLL